MPTRRSLLPPLPPLLPPLFASLAHAARARLPASSSAAVFIIRAPRTTISSLGGPPPCTGDAPRDEGVGVVAGSGRTAARRVDRHAIRARERLHPLGSGPRPD